MRSALKFHRPGRELRVPPIRQRPAGPSAAGDRAEQELDTGVTMRAERSYRPGRDESDHVAVVFSDGIGGRDDGVTPLRVSQAPVHCASGCRRAAGGGRRRGRLLQGHSLRGAPRWRVPVAAAAAGGEVDRRPPGRGVRAELHAGTRVRAASGRGCARGRRLRLRALRPLPRLPLRPTPPARAAPALRRNPPLRPLVRRRRRTVCT